MKRPKWVTVIGVLGIILGVLGLFNAAQTVTLPSQIEMQKQLLESMTTAARGERGQQAATDQFKTIADRFIGTPPAWLGSACVALGIAGALVNLAYAFAGISLLRMKRFAIKLLYATLVASIVFSIVRGATYATALSMMGMSMLFSNLLGAAIDVVLIVVVATADKASFPASQVGAAA
jgi:hypothetical protein